MALVPTAFTNLPLKVAVQPWALQLKSRWLHGGAINAGRSGRAEVALTFDDGPDPLWTPKILDALDSSRLKGTFFVVGKNAAKHPGWVREAVQRGHDIGTHLYTHRLEVCHDLTLLRDEIQRSKAELEPLLGRPLRWLRFPYGKHGQFDARFIKEKFLLDVVHWTFSSHDSFLPHAEDIAQRVSAGLEPGAIVLLHDCLSDVDANSAGKYRSDRSTTVDALAPIARSIEQHQLRSVTLSALLQ